MEESQGKEAAEIVRSKARAQIAAFTGLATLQSMLAKNGVNPDKVKDFKYLSDEEKEALFAPREEEVEKGSEEEESEEKGEEKEEGRKEMEREGEKCVGEEDSGVSGLGEASVLVEDADSDSDSTITEPGSPQPHNHMWLGSDPTVCIWCAQSDDGWGRMKRLSIRD